MDDEGLRVFVEGWESEELCWQEWGLYIALSRWERMGAGRPWSDQEELFFLAILNKRRYKDLSEWWVGRRRKQMQQAHQEGECRYTTEQTTRRGLRFCFLRPKTTRVVILSLRCGERRALCPVDVRCQVCRGGHNLKSTLHLYVSGHVFNLRGLDCALVT